MIAQIQRERQPTGHPLFGPSFQKIMTKSLGLWDLVPYIGEFFLSNPSFPSSPSSPFPSFPHKPQTFKFTQPYKPLTIREYTFGFKFSLYSYTQALPFLPVIYSISNHVFLVKSLSTTTQMSLLSILGFKCNAVNFFCCTWHITRIPERTEAREAPITTQPAPQEPMSARPRGTSLRLACS